MKERHSGQSSELPSTDEFTAKKFFTCQQLGIRTYGNITIRKTLESVTICVSKKLATASKLTAQELKESVEMNELFNDSSLKVNFEITENHLSASSKSHTDEQGLS